MLTCAIQRREVGEPLAGSAPQARLWVLLEQPGPWGRQAVTESHLQPDVGRALQEWADPHPVRLGLIRRPGRHADDHSQQPSARTVLIANCTPGASWLRTESLTDARELLDLDLAALLDQLPEPATSGTNPRQVIAVCTNAKRDQCCALYGRDVALRLSQNSDADVWETSHLGGHRFAPTLVTLPDGYVYGGPDVESLTTDACRGRSTLPPRAQVAEITALRYLGYDHPTPLDLHESSPDRWQVNDPAADTALAVTVTTQTISKVRPESCHKPAFPWERISARVDPDPSGE